MKIENIERLKAYLNRRKLKREDISVIVGYQTNYAVFVHERMDLHHPVGQAKYLEAPARKYERDIVRDVKEIWTKTQDLEKALIIGGLRLQRESQKLVPVDTGVLKNSAFTRVEK